MKSLTKDRQSSRSLFGTFFVVRGFSVSVLLLVCTVGFSGLAQAADATDEKTQAVLIEKLTGVYLNLAPEDSSKVAVTLRLADLHAERARRLSMKELEQNCTVCQAGLEDRKKALRFYNEVVMKVPEASIGKVLTQIGHLYELSGQDAEAIKSYTKVISEQKSPMTLAAAHLSLAELHFKKRRFTEAQTHYAALLEIPAANSKGLAAYRLAWCQFNSGKIAEATAGLVNVLKTPELLNRSSQPGVVAVDTQFQEEVSRDLATFVARATIDAERVSLVFALSPEAAKLQNVTYLASELERLGQPKGALEVWRFIQGKQSKPLARLEGQLRMAQILLEQKNLVEAAKDFDAAMGLWPQLTTQCAAVDCKELKSRTRRFVVDWNRLEKKAPSVELFAAYEKYLQFFADDLEARVWAVQVARELKKYSTAYAWNEIVIRALQAKLSTDLKSADKTEVSAQLESSLLGGIEIAEMDAEASKSKLLLDKAYAAYLTSSLDKKKQVEVRYQKAHLVYQAGQMAEASEQLHAVAIDSTPGSNEIKKQAADLALDALVILKDDTRIQTWSKEFAARFPKNAAEFVAVGRKSVLNQAVSIGTTQAGDSSGQAWAVLAKMDLTGASEEDRISYHKNRLILAEKLNHFREARESADELLRIPSVTEADRQFALGRKSWLAELNLDFETALKTTEKLASVGEQENKRFLKLAMFAELANKDSKPYFQEYLKRSKDEDSGRVIAARLVRENPKPELELEKQKSVLLKDPELFASLALEIFAKSKKIEVIKKALAASAAVGTTATGKVLQRQVFLEDFLAAKGKIQAAKMDSTNQKKLAVSLKSRVGLLEMVEKVSVKAVESGDWTAQLLSLQLLAQESKRFYEEILSLPVPKGLVGDEEQQYLGLISQQAAPHLTKAQDVEKKLQDFWGQAAAFETLEKSYQSSTGAIRGLAKSEVMLIAEIAPDSIKAKLQQIAATEVSESSEAKPSLAQLESARQLVRENPLNRQSLEALMALEKKAGRVAMTSYLESRIQSLDTKPDTGAAGGVK